jgi:hypothetical protein
VDTGPSDKQPGFALQRALVTVLSWIRRVLGSVYQLIFADRLRHIDEQTERLGSASVESVTHLGAEVRALDARLAGIERELTALRELIERREGARAEDGEQVPAGPHSG